MTLFDSGYLEAKSEKQQKLDAALDQIKSRYGENAVIRGSFFPEKEEPWLLYFPRNWLKMELFELKSQKEEDCMLGIIGAMDEEVAKIKEHMTCLLYTSRCV